MFVTVSLPWAIYFEAFYLHVVSSFYCIPVICPKIGVIFNSFAICALGVNNLCSLLFHYSRLFISKHSNYMLYPASLVLQ